MNTKLKYIGLCVCGLALATSAFAQLSNINPKDRAQITYCYGLYQATSDSKEVQKHNAFLEKMGKTYTQIKSNPAFKKGLADGKTATVAQKKSCKLMVYGFLGAAQIRSGYKDNKTLDPAYCLGYINGIQGITDSELQMMMMDYCSKDASPAEKNACFKEVSTELKANTQFAKGRSEAKNVIPLRVYNCYNYMENASEEDMNAAFQSKSQKTTQQNFSKKKQYPAREKDMATKPIF